MPPKNYYGELFAGINGKRIWNSRWKNSFGECFFPVVEGRRRAWSNQRVAELDSVDLFKRKFLLVERLLRCHVSTFTGIRNKERKFNKWLVVRTAVDKRRFKARAIQKHQNVWKKKEKIVDKCNIDDFLSTWRKCPRSCYAQALILNFPSFVTVDHKHRNFQAFKYFRDPAQLKGVGDGEYSQMFSQVSFFYGADFIWTEISFIRTSNRISFAR